MKITYLIVADCDPPPDEDYVQMYGDDLDSQIEDAVATFLVNAGARFSIDTTVSREP